MTKIGDWDQTYLVRVIRDAMDKSPPSHLTHLSVDKLTVAELLTVEDRLQFTRNRAFIDVGATNGAPFTNSWVSYGSPYEAPGYWRDPLGFLHLRGMIKSGTVGAAAFTLPPGFRPAGTKTLMTLSNNAVGRVDIQADGQVIPQSPSSNLWVSLDDLTPFMAA